MDLPMLYPWYAILFLVLDVYSAVYGSLLPMVLLWVSGLSVLVLQGYTTYCYEPNYEMIVIFPLLTFVGIFFFYPFSWTMLLLGILSVSYTTYQIYEESEAAEEPLVPFIHQDIEATEDPIEALNDVIAVTSEDFLSPAIRRCRQKGAHIELKGTLDYLITERPLEYQRAVRIMVENHEHPSAHILEDAMKHLDRDLLELLCQVDYSPEVTAELCLSYPDIARRIISDHLSVEGQWYYCFSLAAGLGSAASSSQIGDHDTMTAVLSRSTLKQQIWYCDQTLSIALLCEDPILLEFLIQHGATDRENIEEYISDATPQVIIEILEHMEDIRSEYQEELLEDIGQLFL